MERHKLFLTSQASKKQGVAGLSGPGRTGIEWAPRRMGNMHGEPSSGRRIRTGLFEVDLRAGELHKEGVRVPLQEQPFRVLWVLLERPAR